MENGELTKRLAVRLRVIDSRDAGKLARKFEYPTKPIYLPLQILIYSYLYESDLVNSKRPLKAVLSGQRNSEVPLWLMRQAGRYLPEYRALRSKKGGFLDLVYNSEAAVTVTRQPIERFGFDGAILFSDILVIAHALGQDLWFEEGEGPRLAPRLIDGGFEALIAQPHRLDPIYATVAQLRRELPDATTLLGFAGSPWTVASYMLNGRGSKDQNEARRYAYAHPAALGAVIAAVEALTITYLLGQIAAGADVIQLFESWSGNLSPAQFEKWVVSPNARIVAALRTKHPDVPVICFPKGAGGKLAHFVAAVKPSAIGLDETVDPIWAAAVLPKDLPVQGNLDPLALLAGGDSMSEAVATILQAFADRPHVFNLGHGILPETPISHVEQLVKMVRAFRC